MTDEKDIKQSWYDVGNYLREAMGLEPIQVCGHPVSAVVSNDEGTSYCWMCERSARRRKKNVEKN